MPAASAPQHWSSDKESTLYVGNLDERANDSIVWQLFTQAGIIVNVHLPKDRVTQSHQGYGFVEFATEDDAEYASKVMNQIRVFGKPIRCNKASADRRGGAGAAGTDSQTQGIGAELFIGNLDPLVDEKVLFDTFQRFGPLLAQPKITRDESNLSKGYGFVSYASFEASDDAIANMHGQYLSNKEITVQYAYKKDGKGERHGDAAERALAASAEAMGVRVQPAEMPASLTGAPVPPTGPSGSVTNSQYPPNWNAGANNTTWPALQIPHWPTNYSNPYQGYGGGYQNANFATTSQSPQQWYPPAQQPGNFTQAASTTPSTYPTQGAYGYPQQGGYGYSPQQGGYGYSPQGGYAYQNQQQPGYAFAPSGQYVGTTSAAPSNTHTAHVPAQSYQNFAGQQYSTQTSSLPALPPNGLPPRPNLPGYPPGYGSSPAQQQGSFNPPASGSAPVTTASPNLGVSGPTLSSQAGSVSGESLLGGSRNMGA